MFEVANSMWKMVFLHGLAIFILMGNAGFVTFGIKKCFWGIFIPEKHAKINEYNE